LRARILLTLARFLVRDFNLIATIIWLNPQIAQIDKNIDVPKPI
jgi:hypothetical protein